MNKSELINSVAESAGLSKKDATSAVEAVFETIQTTLGEGEKVQVIGFGTFEVRERAARKDVTHKQGKKSILLQVKFLPSKRARRLKTQLNNRHVT